MQQGLVGLGKRNEWTIEIDEIWDEASDALEVSIRHSAVAISVPLADYGVIDRLLEFLEIDWQRSPASFGQFDEFSFLDGRLQVRIGDEKLTFVVLGRDLSQGRLFATFPDAQIPDLCAALREALDDARS